MNAFRVQSFLVCHLEQRQQDIATNFRGTRTSGHPEAIAAAGYLDAKAAFNLSQVFIKLAAQIGQAVVIGRLEDYVPRNLDSIQDLYLKPLRRKPPVRKTGAVPSPIGAVAKNLFLQ